MQRFCEFCVGDPKYGRYPFVFLSHRLFGQGPDFPREVSADGGASWADAALREPVLIMAFTRFRMPWRGNGGPAVL
jgi:hypothetical protein